MNYYARFLEDMKYDNDDVLFYKNDNTNKTRYAIVDENKLIYYISMIPNDINCNKVCEVMRNYEDKVFIVVEE